MYLSTPTQICCLKFISFSKGRGNRLDVSSASIDSKIFGFHTYLNNVSIYCTNTHLVHPSKGDCCLRRRKKFPICFCDLDEHAVFGKTAQVKLIDSSSGGWGHINFDDLRGDISCAQD